MLVSCSFLMRKRKGRATLNTNNWQFIMDSESSTSAHLLYIMDPSRTSLFSLHITLTQFQKNEWEHLGLQEAFTYGATVYTEKNVNKNQSNMWFPQHCFTSISVQSGGPSLWIRTPPWPVCGAVSAPRRTAWGRTEPCWFWPTFVP